MKNSVAHFEIYGDDPDKLAQFYTRLFDWTIKPVPGMDYRMIRTVETDAKGMPTKAGGINGGMIKRPTGFDADSWVSYVSVESVDGALESARKLGATVTRGKSPVPGMGWFAMLVDPQGLTLRYGKRIQRLSKRRVSSSLHPRQGRVVTLTRASPTTPTPSASSGSPRSSSSVRGPAPS